MAIRTVVLVMVVAVATGACSDPAVSTPDTSPPIASDADATAMDAAVDSADGDSADVSIIPDSAPVDTADTATADVIVPDTQVTFGETIYVDNQLASACETYDVATRSCGPGAERGFPTFAGAAAVAVAGTEVLIRAGTFAEPLVVEHSGTAAQPVRFAAYGAEEPVISDPNMAPAVELSGREYVILEGLTVDGVRRWMYARSTHHCVIEGNTFRAALDPGGSSKTGLFFQEATYNRITNNLIEDSTQDNLALHGCDHNLIANNTIRQAAHTLWAIKCGNFNVVRDNLFENVDQKIGEIYDCDASGFDHEITALDATKHNLVQGNRFALAVKYYSISGGNGVQNGGQHGLFRRNEFHDTNAGLGMQRYSDEANHDTHNRVAHNVFYANECGGVGLGQGTPDQFGDNLFVNNILFANVGCEAIGTAQIVYRQLAGFRFVSNVISTGTPGGDVVQELFGSAGTLASFEASNPELFADNLDIDPQFEEAEFKDFHLKAGSPAIDQGAFLTTAAGASSGTVLAVADASWFFDGYGIVGEVGDLVQLEGQTATARVVAIDYTANTLTLDSTLTWTDGQGISLAYSGTAPDPGRYEAP